LGTTQTSVFCTKRSPLGVILAHGCKLGS
jgi:hypothetical protein